MVLEDAAGRTGQVSPDTVSVRVEGPADVIAGLKPQALNATVKTVAAQSGRLELRPGIEGLPAAVKVIKVQPPTLEVRLGGAARRRAAP